MADIKEQVVAIIAEKLGVPQSAVTPEATFAGDLNADSLDTVELIMDFEKEFGVEIPDEETQSIKTVGDAIAFIEKVVK